STTRMQMYWQILGFMKYGDLASLARAKMRGDGATGRAGGKTPTPGASPAASPSAAASFAALKAKGGLR
ncbi:MAG: hypothetical protein WA208_04525, partial [Thermoanaerobaculia bacterium]